MYVTTAQDLADYVEELKRETDRGLPLVAAALIDDRLKETLRAFFCVPKAASKLLDGGTAPLSTFSARTEACRALGLIDCYEFAEIGLIRKIRNEFAHAKHGLTFGSEHVIGLCASLKFDDIAPVERPYRDARDRFTAAVIIIVLRLYHRPDWANKQKSVFIQWHQLPPELVALNTEHAVLNSSEN